MPLDMVANCSRRPSNRTSAEFSLLIYASRGLLHNEDLISDEQILVASPRHERPARERAHGDISPSNPHAFQFDDHFVLHNTFHGVTSINQQKGIALWRIHSASSR